MHQTNQQCNKVVSFPDRMRRTFICEQCRDLGVIGPEARTSSKGREGLAYAKCKKCGALTVVVFNNLKPVKGPLKRHA